MTAHRVENFDLPAEGELTSVEVDDMEVGITVVDGKVYAFDDECTHAQCSLADGEIEGMAVVCPCHFGKFDLNTGAVLDGPPDAPLGIWQARLVDGTLELDR
jgi:nitrite reductase/ring-hydroxylating ferredoxin subunit